MSLYTELRPKTFDEVVGNKSTIETLKKFLKKDTKPHTYLFSGGSGCGKTTLARIYAHELGADDLSIKEINVGSDTGVDNMRKIIETMRYKPVNGKPLIYILDEFHMASKSAQNAMLKPFEDTPSHVYFMLCTTDPHKIIKTIHTRCSIAEVENITEEKMFRYLFKLCRKEEYTVDKSVLRKIADVCEGSVRKALVSLEQILQIEDVEEQLDYLQYGASENETCLALCKALLVNNSTQCRNILKDLKTQGIDTESIRYSVLGYMTSVWLNSGKKEAIYIIDCFADNTYDSKYAGIALAIFNACNR